MSGGSNRAGRVFQVDPYSITAFEPVRRPIMRQRWADVTFVHWSYDPSVVQRLLPPGLQVDVIDGRAWVGLVAFRMEDIRFPGLPPMPYLGTFPETNVRTYVRGPDGRAGVWFDSLDINRIIPVLVAQLGYRLPYRWADMQIRHEHDTISYSAQRRLSGPAAVSSSIVVEPSNRTADLDTRARFLTSRWGLFSRFGRRTVYAPVEHPSWPLQKARLLSIQDQLVEAAGYPTPQGDPLVHYSKGVDVKVGLPRPAGS